MIFLKSFDEERRPKGDLPPYSKGRRHRKFQSIIIFAAPRGGRKGLRKLHARDGFLEEESETTEQSGRGIKENPKKFYPL